MGAGAVWVSVVAGVAAADYWCHRTGRATLSTVTRRTLRTHTPYGRALFVAGWAGLSAWFIPHIVTTPAHVPVNPSPEANHHA